MSTPRESSASESKGDKSARTLERVRVGLRRLEKATLRIETPVRAAVGGTRFNPLAHTGTLAVLFFVIVLGTGIYLTAFFQYGFADSHAAVVRLEDNFVGRFVRGLHRYGSVAMVVTSLLHGWRLFVQDRFRGSRWLAWVSGVWMVGSLWIIGVTGYWMLWDERAQGLNEILISALQGSGMGLDWLLDNLLTPAAGTGWPILLGLLIIHIGLSLVLGGLLWMHVKRLTPKLWFPPKPWTATSSIALVALALVLPTGVLPIADWSRMPAEFPIDPFYLFLFPLGLTMSPWVMIGGLTVAGVVISLFPWLRTKRPPGPIIIDEDRCTGCTLCVADCPYGALEMIPREDGKYRQLAVLVPDRCVSCGVCIGSCSDDAMSLPDAHIDEVTKQILAEAEHGESVIIACERHADMSRKDGSSVVPVVCAGMIHPHLAEKAIEAGASDVQIVGCPTADCANRNGNRWAQDRLDRTRVPRLKRRHLESLIISDWVSPIELKSALKAPGADPVVDPWAEAPTDRVVRIGVVTLVFAAVTVIATYWPFTTGLADDGLISIAMDHQGGAPITEVHVEPDVEAGSDSRLVVSIDGDVVLDQTYRGVERDGLLVSQAFERIPMREGLHPVFIELYDRTDPTYSTTLFDDQIALPPGEVLALTVTDIETESRAEAGESLYYESTLGVNAGCRVCHSLNPGEVIVGPSFDGVATRAATAVLGLTAEQYLHESIVDPNAYVVHGFEPDVMLPNFDEILTEKEIGDLVAFLMTLE